ncbi:exocyst complex component EXO70A1-like isoform X3 [Triticum dicoccoides]|uniref:exocyst complex component EXO70A1-like isoform X3 n=1 Tax=Triticum dicoccoides TaxID=85692 RepID=UPI00188F8F26|nr:exocyst complex component EXO70A1-like isoform X3 [Triticum dicoccoides]
MERAAAAEAALLREKASLLRESMRRSEAVREGSAAAVDSIGRRMAAVDEAVRPAQARTWSAYSAHDNVARSLRAVEAVVRHLDAVREAESVILESASKGVTAYLDAVDNLKSAEDFFTSNRIGTAGVDALKRVDELLHKAAAELENEFSRVLSECSKPVELEQLLKCLPSRSSAKDSAESQPNPGAVLSLPTLIDPRYVPRLSKLAQKSVQLGCHKQFVKIYRDTRSSTLELTLKQLGVEYVTAEEVQTAQAESRDAKIAHWIRCLQIAVEAVFAGDECAENRKSASTLVKCLAQAAKKTLIDFKDSIVKESPKNTSTDGDVHPLTSYVGNYIKYLMDYQSSLKLIFQESSNGDGTKSGLVSEISGLIHAVETNLDVKAKQYKDHALGILFLMNNINYIVRSIRGSEAKDLVGDDWIQRRRRTVQQHATQYKRVAWGKVLECLSAQGLTSSVGSATEGIAGSVGSIGSHSGTTSTSVIKARFKSFNKQFEEVCQTQMNWAIPDKELRDNLILAVAEILLPAYRSFLKRFGPLVENSHHASKYMKYTPEALEQTLGNLFAKKLPQ